MRHATAENVRHTTCQAQPSNHITALTPERLLQAKLAFSCRRAAITQMETLIAGDIQPRSGDLVLARVDKIGQHKNIETPHGRRHLFVGDEIIVCYGNRYAPDQFEAEVPADLSPCDLVAAGGVASTQLSRHDAMAMPTSITPIGLVGDALGGRLNIARWALRPARITARGPKVIAVVGTTMNAGKTTTAANVIRGLAQAGFDVGAVKVTGTASPNDTGFFRDAGANPVLDFTDAGFASTYRVSDIELEAILETLLSNVAHKQVVVIEIADGLFQQETNVLLRSPLFKRVVDGVVFAAGDAMGAKAGIEWLHANGLPVLAVSGVLTRSPLAIREAEAATGMPVLTLQMIIAGADDLVKGLPVRCAQP